MKTRWLALCGLAVLALVFAGCENKEAPTGAAGTAGATNNEAVTVTIGMGENGFLTEEEFDRYITSPVRKKTPWITVQPIIYGEGANLPQLVAAGQTPDMVIHHNIGGMDKYIELGLTYPLTEMIKKHNMNLARFEPEVIAEVKASSRMDELMAIPYTRHFSVLYYNKDIFDKFGVPYPKDGMTWDDAYDLAIKVTRREDNVQYRGLETNVIQRPASQLTLPYVDAQTNKAVINTDQWKKVLEMMVKIHLIPGNEQVIANAKANDLFVKDRTLAMFTTNNILFTAHLDTATNLNWDMASLPTWKEAPGLGFRLDQHMLSITATSKNKDADFLVISTVTSDEVQTDLTRQGRLSILQDPKIKDAFGADLAFLKGKNMKAIFATKPAKAYVPTVYDDFGLLNTAMKDVVAKKKDVNTALREAEDKLNQKIKEQMAAQ
ncbi:MAG: extracellular solute-binding protein family 1 [Paenibacillaceae bacterium]|jgi:multiple sugar transport system substrate-binding protein|nr:extracellular solute-binding protein family 1 [Paenibacillaceae bacterium]